MNRQLAIETIAAACHEQNRIYCRSIGDVSQMPWTQAPEWQRKSAIEGVEAALLDPSPGRSHERWMASKIQDGWKYGALKDADRKTHPCLLPFSDLPPEQQQKDIFFVDMVVQLSIVLGNHGVTLAK